MKLKFITVPVLIVCSALLAMPEPIAGLTQETPVFATPTADSTAVPWSSPADSGLALMGTLFRTLGVILGLTLVLYLGLRFYKSSMHGGTKLKGASIEVLGTSILAPGKTLSIVQVLEHLLVLAVAGDNITVVLDVAVNDLSDEARKTLIESQVPAGQNNFSQTLSNLMRKTT